MQAYDQYKDSGIEWLGEIPGHWECKRLGSWFEERRTKVSDREFEPLSVTKNGVLPQLENAAKSNDGDNRKLVIKGDFVINSRSDRKGSSGISDRDGSVSLINIVLKPRGISSAYTNYLLKSNSFVEEFYRNGHGIVADLWTTRFDEMKFINIVFPPLPEQQAIAAFLDDKCGKIDEAVRIKQQQIEKLKELRQITIHNTVTKGINPDAEMKDSGIDWIGEIPKHWEVKRLKYVFQKILTGTTPHTSNEGYFNGDVDWYNPKDLNNEVLLKADKKVTFKAIEDNQVKLFEKDSILVVGIGATAGKTSYLTNDATFNQQITGFKSTRENNKFYFQTLRSLSNVFLALAQFTTLPILNNEFFKNVLLPHPPLTEQKQIVSYLDAQTSKIDKAIALKTEQIAKLNEYKQSLINDVVTGKIKVTN